MKKTTAALALWASILSALCFAGCRAQDPSARLQMGERREGLLRPSDPLRTETPRGPENRWVFEGRSGQTISVTAESYEFDSLLLLIDPLGRRIAWSDNSAGFFNPRIRAELDTTGQYTVVLCGANADQLGTYWITLGEGSGERDSHQGVQDASAYYSRGTEWARQTGNERALAWVNLCMAQHSRQRRQWEAAQNFCDEAGARADESGFAYARWAVALEQGKLFARRRQYDRAVSEFQRAREMSANLRAAGEAEALALIEFGNLYQSTARAHLAKVCFKSAAIRAEQNEFPSTLVELYASLSSLSQSEDRQEAIEYAERCFLLCDGVDPALELKAMHTLAGTYLFLQPDRAEEGRRLASRMRDRARELGCLDEEVAALTLMSMGEYAGGNVEGMIKLAGEALSLTSPSDDNPNPRRIALQLQADGEMIRGNNRAALNSCLKALQTVESAWASEQVEELRSELLSQSRAICTQVIKNLYALQRAHPSMEYARQAFDYAERSRSRSLLDHLVGGGADADTGADLQVLAEDQEIMDRLSAVRGQLVMMRASGGASRETLLRLQDERATLIAQRTRLQSKIRQSATGGYRNAHLTPLTAEQAQKKLAEDYPNSVILYYQLGIQESFLILVSQSGFHLFKLPDWTTISNRVNEWRAQISAQMESVRPAPQTLPGYMPPARELYRMLVEPAAHLIKGRDLIVITSGALSQLSFESLVAGGRGESARPRYLIDRHAVSYAPSASILAEVESRWQMTPASNRMLLMADSAARAAPGEAAPDGGLPVALPLESLPAARTEVLEIADLARRHGISATALLGADVREERLKDDDLPTFRFIHVATHGLADSQDGYSSALTLSLNPAGEEDGILTGDEIAKLRLRADMVALSGCETASGEEAGAEGIVGLNRSFLIAGARCVCSSLWPVEDSSTQKLMSAFYGNLLARGFNKSQALRLAKLELIRQGASPAQWAPFILVGSTR